VKQNLFDGVLSDKNTTNYVDFSTKGRSQFIQQIEELIKEQELLTAQIKDDLSENQLIETIETPTEIVVDSSDVVQLELFEEQEEQEEQQKEQERLETEKKSAEIEQVMNNGMQFLAGLFKMSTGKDIGLENQKIEIDKKTGEVVMRFKLA
jgi:hypothetical protein